MHIEICLLAWQVPEGSGLWEVAFLRLPGARAVEKSSLTVPLEATWPCTVEGKETGVRRSRGWRAAQKKTQRVERGRVSGAELKPWGPGTTVG